MDSLSNLRNWLMQHGLNGSSLKMSLGYSTVEMDKISRMSSKHWMTSGISWRGEFWTQSTLEHPNGVVESSLSQVIKTTVPPECFLKLEHLEKWLKRVELKSTQIPSSLERAFKRQIFLLSNTQPLEESQKRGRKRKDTETMEKPIHLTQEEAQILFVRRMTALEYEALQGFPENWTLVD